MNSNSNVLALSDQEIATFAHQLDHLATVIGEGFQPLDAKAAKRLLKLHAKRQAVVPEITRLATVYGVDSKSAPLAAMKEHLAAVDKLQPLVEKVAAVHKLLSDLLLSSQSEAWKGASSNYALLRAESAHNVILKNALLPIRDALRTKKKKSQSNSSANTATPPTAPAGESTAPAANATAPTATTAPKAASGTPAQ